MRLNLFNSVLRGSLKPSNLPQDTERHLRQQLSKNKLIADPGDKLVVYHEVLKSVFPDALDVYLQDGLELYLKQTPCSSKVSIEMPLVEINGPQPKSHIQKFFLYALHHETTRLMYRLHRAMYMEIIDTDRYGIIARCTKNIRQFLIDIPDLKPALNSEDDAFALSPVTNSLIRLLVEVETLFPSYIPSSIHSPTHIYCLLLGEVEAPYTEWPLTLYGKSLLGQKPISKPKGQHPTKWFKLKEQHHEYLVDLYNLLKGYECFESGTNLANFRAIFNGKKPTNKFIWLGHIGDLHSLIKELINQEKIEKISSYWQVASKCFVQAGEVPISPSSLRTAKTTEHHEMIKDQIRHL